MNFKDWLRTSKVLFVCDTHSIDGHVVDCIAYNVEGGMFVVSLHTSKISAINKSIDNFWYRKTFIMFRSYPIGRIHIVRKLRGIAINDLNAIKPTDTIRYVR